MHFFVSTCIISTRMHVYGRQRAGPQTRWAGPRTRWAGPRTTMDGSADIFGLGYGHFRVIRGLASLNGWEIQTGRRTKVPVRGFKNDCL
jgi:hypothetical protein